MINQHQLDKKIIPVAALLSVTELNIPHYQRPYKWTQKHLNDLLQDIRRYLGKSAYRLGALVFHRNRQQSDHGSLETLDIVDGQQRTLTLILVIKAILVECSHKLERQDLVTQLQSLQPQVDAFIKRQIFTSDISQHNLHQNYLAARRAVARPDFSEEDIDFFLNHCQLVTFVIDDVSEAFQFFDSQNARGRDLAPHDLLKAFHLREFSAEESDLKARAVQHWESLDCQTLANTFANYLYRIRQWIEGKPAHHFGKANIAVFKGVNLANVASYPYIGTLRIAHHFVDDYNQQYQRRIDQQSIRFPFHLDQMIVNGRRFFEMINHYQQLITRLINDEHHGQNRDRIQLNGVNLDPRASNIIHTLNTYSSRYRTGDKYIRTLFDCALIFYVDKFGMQDISAAVEKLFIWAYRCRLQMQVVQLATMDNYACEQNVFKVIKNAVHPADLLNLPLDSIKDIHGTKLKEIIELFKDLKYHE